MIHPLQDISKYSLQFIEKFLKNCDIQEKIDTHYITAEIMSQDIILRKANGNVISRTDMILNSMWNNLFIDWNYLKMTNTQWFTDHAGFSFKFFYFPTSRPITVQYPENLRYIFDRAVFNNNELDVKDIIQEINFPKAYTIGFKRNLTKNPDLNDNFYSEAALELKHNTCDIWALMDSLLADKTEILAVDKPEGLVLKYKNKLFKVTDPDTETPQAEKASYEYLLMDFIKYCRVTQYQTKISSSYEKTICALFNDYIANWVNVNKNIEKNITAESLESPYKGSKPSTGFSYIPDQITKMLCHQSTLYENIFKILLANLKKGKDEKRCLIMPRKYINDWNNIVKNIKIRTEKIL